MKPNIHPDNYRTVLFFDSSANEGWLIRSCAETHGKTMVWTDGKEYPLFSLDTSSASHPVYTGKQRNVNTEGRASKFNQRFQSVMSSFRQGQIMQVLSSLKTAKQRHRDCQIVRRRGKVYVICKSNPRFKARQR